ncbi:MAG: stage II sporulation protein M [Planctomycetota bacterium]|nr:stage II sporulation protein M [Planctomycetota bacterium]
MNKRQFVTARKEDWQKFEKLLNRFDKVISKNLDSDQAAAFSKLFRELCHDLSMVRSRGWGKGLSSYLNDLVSRGHNAFYRAPPARMSAIVWFLTVGFPQLFRRNIRYFVASALLFFGPMAVTWGVIQHNPELARRVIPAEQLEQMQEMYPKVDEPTGSSWKSSSAGSGERLIMAGFYTQHNVSIALDCFGRGILFGAGTAYTLIFNGIALGAISGYLVGTGHHAKFLTFVVSHGSFELVAIAVAGGAGLMLGHALLHPGQRTRFESLWHRGLEAVQIAVGAGAMLLMAALIEAFWSPADVPDVLKVGVGALLWIFVVIYLSIAGRWERST